MSYKEKICGIYCIENLINKKKYIGQSININQRFNSHKSELRHNNHNNIHLQNAWNKYGEKSFRFYIIEICDKHELDEKEREYVENFNAYKEGYNRDLGGVTGDFRSQETIIKLKKSKEYISDEARENMRNSQFSIPIFQFDLNGNLINEWIGCREASKKLNINQSCLWSCINHQRKTYKNFIWITKEEYYTYGLNLSNYVRKTNPKPKTIIQFDLNYNIIKIWDTIRSIHKELNYKSDLIIDCCKKRRDNYKNCRWMYYDEYKSSGIDTNIYKDITNCKKVKCLNTHKIFNSLKEASEWCNLKGSSHITNCCNGTRKSAGKHPNNGEKLRWEYVD